MSDNIRVLLCFPQEDKRTGLSILRGLDKLGCRTAVVDAKKEPRQIWPVAQKFKPQILLCSRTSRLVDGVMDIKANMPNVKVFTWNSDVRESVAQYAQDFGDDLINLFLLSDIVYTVASGDVKRFNEAGIKSRWLMQGIDDDSPEPEAVTTYKHDISFLCNITRHHIENRDRANLVNALVAEFGDRLNMNPAYDDEAIDVYHSSKINIGNNEHDSLGPSVRDFRILGAGGFLLTTYAPGIYDEFPGVATYRDIPDAIAKCHYWLSEDNEQKRKQKADTLSNFARRTMMYSDRIQAILDDYEEMKNG